MISILQQGSTRVAAFAASAVMLLITSGCDQRGLPGMRDEWERRRAEQFFVLSASNEAAVISALGREVAIKPADGFCLSRESIETSDKSAVALIGDCALEADVSQAKRSSRGELRLPRALPGIITVSISGDPNTSETSFDFDEIEEFLQSPQGMGLVGRTPDGSKVRIRESRREGDAVYILVEDKNAGPIPILSDTFWRAFVTLKDRLAVITINGFRASPLGVETMLGHLSEQVDAMQQANSGSLAGTKRLIAQSRPIDAERIASAETGGVSTSAPQQTDLRDLTPTSIIVSTTGTGPKPATPQPKPAATLNSAETVADAAPASEKPTPELTVEPSTTLPVAKVSVPKVRPSVKAPKATTQTATLRNPAAGASQGEATAPTSAPLAPKRRRKS